MGNAAPLITPATNAPPVRIFVGRSSSGKTTLIEKLLLEIKSLAQ